MRNLIISAAMFLAWTPTAGAQAWVEASASSGLGSNAPAVGLHAELSSCRSSGLGYDLRASLATLRKAGGGNGLSATATAMVTWTSKGYVFGAGASYARADVDEYSKDFVAPTVSVASRGSGRSWRVDLKLPADYENVRDQWSAELVLDLGPLRLTPGFVSYEQAGSSEQGWSLGIAWRILGRIGRH